VKNIPGLLKLLSELGGINQVTVVSYSNGTIFVFD
jgi:hypothetical protein